MDVKLTFQGAVSPVLQSKPVQRQAQPGGVGKKAVAAQKAAEESPASKAGQQAGQAAQSKTVFAVDGNNKVVLQVLDSKGKVLQQLPPEEFGPVAKELKALMKNLFSREA